MLRQIDILNKSGGTLYFPLRQPTNGLILNGVSGLEPTQATVTTTDFSQQDGAEFHSARRESRNILMGFILDSRYGGLSVRQLREELYRVMMPKSEVLMTLYLEENLTVTIDGVVESIQAPMFSRDPGAVVSIICPTPDFKDNQSVLGSGEGHSTHNWYDIPYTGSSPSGIDFEIEVNSGATTNGFALHMRRPIGSISTLRFSAPLQGGDIVRVSSHPGLRRATLVRGGASSSIMSGITPNSRWPMLERGTNRISVVTNGGQFYYEYEYNRRYGGL